MLIKATCHACDNKDVSEFKHYNGLLGYEAYVCKKCGAYFDQYDSYPADKWSRDLVGLPPVPEMVEAQPNRKVVWKP
jgi:hypothetical protein